MGLTAVLATLAVLLGGSRLEYLAPFWRAILTSYGFTIAVHVALAMLALAVGIYGAARAAGLANLGRPEHR